MEPICITNEQLVSKASENTIDQTKMTDNEIRQLRLIAGKALNAAGVLIDFTDLRDPIDIARQFNLI